MWEADVLVNYSILLFKQQLPTAALSQKLLLVHAYTSLILDTLRKYDMPNVQSWISILMCQICQNSLRLLVFGLLVYLLMPEHILFLKTVTLSGRLPTPVNHNNTSYYSPHSHPNVDSNAKDILGLLHLGMPTKDKSPQGFTSGNVHTNIQVMDIHLNKSSFRNYEKKKAKWRNLQTKMCSLFKFWRGIQLHLFIHQLNLQSDQNFETFWRNYGVFGICPV